ncbi:MAG: hypothetical protein EXR79_16935 [Myxococcales bacterium]|nr:hypothetical protein [Myxococcales bacterium]
MAATRRSDSGTRLVCAVGKSRRGHAVRAGRSAGHAGPRHAARRIHTACLGPAVGDAQRGDGGCDLPGLRSQLCRGGRVRTAVRGSPLHRRCFRPGPGRFAAPLAPGSVRRWPMKRARRSEHLNRLLLLVLVVLPGVAQAFTFQPAGVLKPGSGKGLQTTKVYAPTMRYPTEKSPSYPNSQVWGVGGSQGPKGGQCDAKNFAYPWWDNYCETRTWSMPLCPSGKGHQGQDIRGATCVNKTHWLVAAEAGTITGIGTYSVYLKAGGTTFRYLHMDPGTLAVQVGQKVSKGQKLGLMSNAFGGTPTTVHLHFDIEQFVSGTGTVFVSPYNSLVESYEKLIGPADPCAGKDCNDKQDCTKDTCAAGTCNHTPVSGACSDGDACSLGDVCSAGKCKAGAAKVCSDNNACTKDACAPPTAGSPANTPGVCVFTPEPKACDDGNACTIGDACNASLCAAGGAKDCKDGIDCTQDVCTKGVCSHPPLAGTCDDKNPCTVDTCGTKGCVHVANDCADDNACTTDSCTLGKCVHAAKAGPCDDGNACSDADACDLGVCKGTTKVCDDAEPCTSGACANGGCVQTPVVGSCDDGDDCSLGDACSGGQCEPGSTKDCDDGLDCTLDGCSDGECTHKGELEAEVKNCVGGFVEAYDACGAGPMLEECPPEKPCESGACGGEANPLPGDAGGGADVTGDADATDDAGPAKVTDAAEAKRDVAKVADPESIFGPETAAPAAAGAGAAAPAADGCGAGRRSSLAGVLTLLGLAGIGLAWSRRKRPLYQTRR